MTDKKADNLSTATTKIAGRKYKKTPLFSASHAARYQRQEMIRALEEKTGRRLICYVGGERAEIGRRDVCGFVDLVFNLETGDQVDFLIHSGGGDIDTAEKLIRLLRTKVGEEGAIRAIIPDYAKSAATLLAIGCDTILMSDSSELGAIDPQFPLNDGQGNQLLHSVKRYLQAYRLHSAALTKNPDDPVARIMVEKFDPVIIKKFEGIEARARQLADRLLLRKGGDYTKIATDLLDIEKWQSHNQMISAADAVDIGLDVEVEDFESDLWTQIWEIYSHQHLELDADPTHKLYESAFVSLQY